MLRILLIFFVWLFPVKALSKCDDGKEIWEHEGNEIKTVAYFPEPIAFAYNILIFEGWRNNKINWRITAGAGCSNGVVICGIDIPYTDGKQDYSFELITENDEPTYLVIPQLAEWSFRRQVYESSELIAEWFVPIPTDDDSPRIILPSVYKFIGCQKGNELQGGMQEYDEFRSQLISDGWKPAPQTKETDCFSRNDFLDCKKYPEIRNCAGTGNGKCNMQWIRGDETKIIFTIGERPKLITRIDSTSEK